MVVQVARKKGRYIAETLFNFLFIERWTEDPCAPGHSLHKRQRGWRRRAGCADTWGVR